MQGLGGAWKPANAPSAQPPGLFFCWLRVSIQRTSSCAKIKSRTIADNPPNPGGLDRSDPNSVEFGRIRRSAPPLPRACAQAQAARGHHHTLPRLPGVHQRLTGAQTVGYCVGLAGERDKIISISVTKYPCGGAGVSTSAGTGGGAVG